MRAASSLASTLPTIPCVTGPASIASNDTSDPAMPNAPTICAAMRVACARSPPGPVPDSPKNSSSAVIPPNAIFIEPTSSERVRV